MTFDEFSRLGSDAPIFGRAASPTFAEPSHSAHTSRARADDADDALTDARCARDSRMRDASACADAVTRYLRAFVR
jgi:hypothetical protein